MDKKIKEAREYNQKYREKNREAFRRRNKKYRQSEKGKKTIKEYRENNKEFTLELKRRWIERNKDHIKRYYDKWMKDNKKHTRQYRRDYYKKYPERLIPHLLDGKKKENQCKLCRTKKELQFHHTNYEKREGITLCRKCHKAIHKNISLS